MSATEIKCIDDLFHKLGSMNARAISEYSQKDVPWMVTNGKEIIDYEFTSKAMTRTKAEKESKNPLWQAHRQVAQLNKDG